jgi:hypothetical protein
LSSVRSGITPAWHNGVTGSQRGQLRTTANFILLEGSTGFAKMF